MLIVDTDLYYKPNIHCTCRYIGEGIEASSTLLLIFIETLCAVAIFYHIWVFLKTTCLNIKIFVGDNFFEH